MSNASVCFELAELATPSRLPSLVDEEDGVKKLREKGEGEVSLA
jgi:hypothetical protein